MATVGHMVRGSS
uniref:Uncharacterized protein n=1 Tax=Arundo donax TaxID=35708 RepID=A0A0A9C6U3_ARUDO